MRWAQLSYYHDYELEHQLGLQGSFKADRSTNLRTNYQVHQSRQCLYFPYQTEMKVGTFAEEEPDILLYLALVGSYYFRMEFDRRLARVINHYLNQLTH